VRLSYEKAGVSITAADQTKAAMAPWVATGDERVLNRLGAFASLFEASFPDHREPVLVLKTEEPGSKQKLAFQNGQRRSLCYDLVNHLINDIAVMGAQPLSVQDAIICGKLEPDVVTELVRSIAEACREQGCTLTGGETSEQPGVLEAGTYILTASVVGVVEKSQVIDGTRIVPGDRVIALASNGLHTNGYSLVRALLAQDPELARRPVEGEPFLQVVLRPHLCYYHALRGLFRNEALHGLAHITGGGIEGNLRRIMPPGLQAHIDLSTLRIPGVFRTIREAAEAADEDMLRTFNMGVGLIAVVAVAAAEAISAHLERSGCQSYAIGEVTAGSMDRPVVLDGTMAW